MRLHAAAVVALLFVPSTAWAYGESEVGFPNWGERVVLEWANRARCDPQVEMAACGGSCPEGACYVPGAPVTYDVALGHAARFHSDEMAQQGYFAHNSNCTVVANIDDLYPASCDGSASCACVGGVEACSPTCTVWSARIGLFGAGASGEIIASGTDPNGAFYQWLFESYNQSTCGYNQGPPTNGHRYNLLMAGPAFGVGIGLGPSVGDFGGTAVSYKIPSGAHYPRQAAAVEAWANWYDGAGPMSALIDVEGTCTPMTLTRGVPTNGAYLANVSGVATGCHRYFFHFKDSGGSVVDYPTTGSLGIGDASCSEWDATRPALGSGCDCTPSCAGLECGDDGCGGSCGACGDGKTCSAGQCVSSSGVGGGGGSGPAAGGSSANGGASASGGGANGGGDAGSNADDGCGCRIERRDTRGGAVWLLALAAAWGMRRSARRHGLRR